MKPIERVADGEISPPVASTEARRDQALMREALALAGGALGLTSPNPAVGCVIVRAGTVVGRGVTAPGGRPHAETAALAAAGNAARGATAYVSFEPCAHQGQTPPCAHALVAAGVSRVVVGCVDPYPRVRGRGLAILRQAGIATITGVLEDECRRLNEGFISRVTRGRPFVTLKLAASLDGRIAAASGDSRWISSPASRDLVHRWRREADAVIVGAATVIADNPRLNCRLPGGRDPVRVVIDGRLRVSPAARMFHLRSAAGAMLVTTPLNLARARRRYQGSRVEVLAVEASGSRLSLAALMREFGRRGWCRVLLEGGAHLAAEALAAGVVDRIALFLAPRIIGCGLSAIEGLTADQVRHAMRLHHLTAQPVGEDWLLEAGVGAPSRRQSSSTAARRPRRG